MSSDSDRRRPSADTFHSSAGNNLVSRGAPGKSSLTAGALPQTTHDLIVPAGSAPRSVPIIGTGDATGGNSSHAERTPVAVDEVSVSSSLSRAFGVGAATHAPPSAPRVADRGHPRLNAVLKVVAYDGHGSVIRSWGAKARWEGPLPQHFHGDFDAGGWRWDNLESANTVRVDTRADGTGGESVEGWAGKLHATRIEIFAKPIEAVTERAEARVSDTHDPHAPGHAEDADDVGGGSSEKLRPIGHGPGEIAHLTPEPYGHGEHTPDAGASSATAMDTRPAGGSEVSEEGAKPGDRLADAIAFERELGIDLTQDEDAGEDDGDASTKPRGQDSTGGAGYEGGDPTGRTGKDASTTGQGPGGDAAKEGGDDEESSSTRDNLGTKTGDRDGELHGSANGRYDGEGREGDDGVRGAGAIFGGLVAVPAALKGAVEIGLLIDAGDITGAGADLFKAGAGKALSVAAARTIVAQEARIAAEREMHAVVKALAEKKVFTSLSKAEQERVLRIVYWEKQRQFFRGYLKAATAEQRAVRQALKKAKPVERAALEARQAAAQTGEEIAKAEPVAGRLPRNHAYAGHEYPPSKLPPAYRKQGLRFKDTGYPDFEPYATVLPNGQKKVRIAYAGRNADAAVANKAAKLEETPRGYTWHHNEDMETMSLVPSDLHDAVEHSGGTAEYKHRHGVKYAD